MDCAADLVGDKGEKILGVLKFRFETISVFINFLFCASETFGKKLSFSVVFRYRRELDFYSEFRYV